MIPHEFRGSSPVDWRSLIRVGDDHADQQETSPGNSFQNRAPLVPPPSREIGLRSRMRLLLLALGVFLLLLGCQPWQQSYVTRNWPVADGVIVRSALLASHGHAPDGAGWFHRTWIEYSYSFDNKSYLGSRIGFGAGDQYFMVGDFARRLVQRYPEGKPVRIYFNPHNPAEAVLETTPSAGGSLIFLVLGMICLSGRYFLGLSEKWRARSCRK
ncbi:MAG: DUF3592 domain-containing protein [Magnetococcales bacterium]|nr:DUF3592 domain-containing protein [Magnetococcales bacterium]